jgi:hypothetical protein
MRGVLLRAVRVADSMKRRGAQRPIGHSWHDVGRSLSQAHDRAGWQRRIRASTPKIHRRDNDAPTPVSNRLACNAYSRFSRNRRYTITYCAHRGLRLYPACPSASRVVILIRIGRIGRGFFDLTRHRTPFFVNSHRRQRPSENPPPRRRYANACFQ